MTDQGTGALEARFWSKVQKSEGCWIWVGAKNTQGYGSFKFDGHVGKAHRFSYQIHVGPIPQGLEVDHRCRVRACVNPFHLEPVTHAVNSARRGNSLATATHCPKGHAMDEANTAVIIRSDTGKVRRCCRACFRGQYHERRKRSLQGDHASTTDGRHGAHPGRTSEVERSTAASTTPSLSGASSPLAPLFSHEVIA